MVSSIIMLLERPCLQGIAGEWETGKEAGISTARKQMD
jgi:hypothetical protein